MNHLSLSYVVPRTKYYVLSFSIKYVVYCLFYVVNIWWKIRSTSVFKFKRFSFGRFFKIHIMSIQAFEIYMCRHGESEANAAGLCQGFEPGRLTPKGRVQAAALGRTLFSKDTAEKSYFDAIWCSDLTRVRETLDIAMKAGNVKDVYTDSSINFSELLREKNAGELEGKPRNMMQTQRKRHGNFRTFTPPGGECWDDVMLRAKDFMALLLQSERVKEFTVQCNDINLSESMSNAKQNVLTSPHAVSAAVVSAAPTSEVKRVLVFTSGGFIMEFVNAYIYRQHVFNAGGTAGALERTKYYSNCAANCTTYVFRVQQQQGKKWTPAAAAALPEACSASSIGDGENGTGRSERDVYDDVLHHNHIQVEMIVENQRPLMDDTNTFESMMKASKT